MKATTPNQDDIVAYINHHSAAVLGTINEDGTPHGAVIYICATSAEQLYFVTKNETQKFQNLLKNPHVSITILDTSDNSTLQAGGVAKVIGNDAQMIEMVLEKITKIQARSVDWLPPLAKLRAGAYQIVEIKLTHARLARFKDVTPGGQVFKEA